MLKRIWTVLEAVLGLLRDRPFVTAAIQVPGIGTGSAYASGDQFGTQGAFDVPVRGTILSAKFFDIDDEGIAKDLLLFSKVVTVVAADNAAIDIKIVDMQNAVHTVSFSAADFVDYGSTRLASVGSIGKAYYAPDGRLYFLIKTYGADNIAANQLPQVQLEII